VRDGGSEDQGRTAAAAWERWHEADYTWEGLKKRTWQGWVVCDDGLVREAESGAVYGQKVPETASPASGRAATLQDYWRADPAYGHWRNDEEMGDELVRADGQPTYHRIHLPLTYKDGPATGKEDWPETDLDDLLRLRIAAATETTWEGKSGVRTVVGPDRRARLDGGVLLSFDTERLIQPSAGQRSLYTNCQYTFFIWGCSCGSTAFLGDTSFDYATFSEYASFDRAAFLGVVGFRWAAFSDIARFFLTTFSEYVSFDSTTYSGDATFSCATFSGDANFDRATFSGFAWFERTRFSGDAEFKSTTFPVFARFADTTFSGDVSFNSATFSGDAHFDSMTFPGAARFQSVKFLGRAWFFKTAFSGLVDFNSATFSGDAAFMSTTFSGFAYFDGATFSDDAKFDNASFSGKVRLDRATFSRHASFNGAKFSGFASFDGAKFYDDAEFDSASFSGDASFVASGFARTASFRGGTFEKQASFATARFQERTYFDRRVFKSDMDFTAAVFEQLCSFEAITWPEAALDWHSAFDQVLFRSTLNIAGSGFRSFAAFDGGTLERGIQIDEITEAEAKETFGQRMVANTLLRNQRLRELERGCRVLKLAMEKSSNKSREQLLYRFELQARRAQSGLPPGEKLFSHLYAFTSDYGASMVRPFLALGVVVGLFAVIYGLMGSTKGAWPPDADAHGALAFSVSRVFPFGAFEGVSRNWICAFETRSGAWPTLAVRALATLQSLFAIVLAFLFALAIRRRFQIS
jgi:hypothetical protein